MIAMMYGALMAMMYALYEPDVFRRRAWMEVSMFFTFAAVMAMTAGAR